MATPMMGQIPSVPPFSSIGRSIEAYQPYYAPPPEPQTNYIHGSSALTQKNVPAAMGITSGAAVVSSKPRRGGNTFLYSRGGRFLKWFKMIATGQVESTKFQPQTASTFYADFNPGLYKAGYPRNMAWTEKVPTLPPLMLGTSPSQMAPAPRYTRSIYSSRSFATAPAIPAKPYNGK
jgi:hypothetical protein